MRRTVLRSGAPLRLRLLVCRPTAGPALRLPSRRALRCSKPQFVEAHLQHFSREGLRYALEKQPAAVRGRLLAQHKRVVDAKPAAEDGIPCSDRGEGGAPSEAAQQRQQAPAPKRQRKRR